MTSEMRDDRNPVVVTLIDEEGDWEPDRIYDLRTPSGIDTIKVERANRVFCYEVTILRPTGWLHLLFGDDVNKRLEQAGYDEAIGRACSVLFKNAAWKYA